MDSKNARTSAAGRVQNLDLALIGNSTIAALIERDGTISWGCFPRFDSDALFCSLLRERREAADFGFFAIDLADFADADQRYEPDTAIVRTTLRDSRGGALEIVDFAPRFRRFGRMFCPTMLVRQVRRLSGSPRITVRLRPAKNYGVRGPRRRMVATTSGSSRMNSSCARRPIVR
jgi:GH15 family glucan-1,4-alpha-glucosidase